MKKKSSTRHVASVIIGGLLVTAAAHGAKYTADVQVVSNFKSEVRVLAVAPATCPPHIDCLWIEEKIGRDLEKYGFAVVPASKVKQALFDLGLDSVSASINEVLDVVKADALLQPTVGHSGKEGEGGVGIVSGGSVIIAEDEKKTGQVSVLISGKDGKKLLSGTGYGRSGNDFKSQKGVVLKIFQRVFAEGFK